MSRVGKCSIGIGDKFWNVTVVGQATTYHQNKTRVSKRQIWICACICGKLFDVEGYNLRSGHFKSCGCLRYTSLVSKAARKNRRKAHGLVGSPEYMTWVRMRRRCNNPKSTDYPYYGARGITVCERWNVFENFLEDMGKRPSNGYMIDRVDNNGHYEPNNCRWATAKESNGNKRDTRYLTIENQTNHIAGWSNISGVSENTIRSRLKRGWEPKEAVFGELKQDMKRTGNRWKKRPQNATKS